MMSWKAGERGGSLLFEQVSEGLSKVSLLQEQLRTPWEATPQSFLML